MGWIHIDTNIVSAIGRLIFNKRERFEDFWTLSFTNRSDVMSAYAQNVTAVNQPIVFTNKTSSANVGNIKIHIFEETTFGTTPVGDNFSWSSSGTNVNVAANGTYSYQGITHTSTADEFYYDGTSHGVSPYSGILDGAHSYRIQFIYTDENGIEYLSDFYDFGSHYYYTQPFASFEQAIRGDVDLVFTVSAPSETYDLGDTIVGTLTATNTYPYACTLGFIAPDGVTLSQSIFENVSSGSTVTTTFEYTIAEEDIIRGYKTFNFGGSIGNVSMDPIDINGKTVSCAVQTEPVRAHMSLEFTLTSPTPQEGFNYDDSIAYSIVLTNDGNVTLQGELGTEKMDDLWTFPSLSPGSSLPFSTEGNSIITETDIIQGFATIDFYALGENLDSGESFTINDYDTLSTVAIVDNVTITITTEEEAPAEGWHLGQEINYVFNIENTGNTSLTNCTIKCELVDGVWTFENLALGASETLTGSYTVIEDNVLDGKVLCEVIVTADSWDSDNPEYTISETDSQLVEDCNPTLTFTPIRSIDKTTYYEGDAIKWNLLVTNTGNLTVNNLEIWNLTTNTYLMTIDQFSPGDSEIIEDEYWINDQDALSGELIFRWEAKGVALNKENIDVICTDTFTTSQTIPSYVFTINYRIEDLNGDFNQIIDTENIAFQEGDSVWVTTPAMPGFTPNKDKVGINSMPARDVSITVLYRRDIHTVTIKYSCTNSDVTIPSNYEGDYKYNQSYSIEVPTIPGYIPSQEIITGTMDTFNQTYFVKYYSANQYCRLIVRYYRLELDGSYTSLTSGMYAPVTRIIEHGKTYNITSPSMTNYTPDPAVVSGVLNDNKEINVYYDRPRHQLTIHYYMQQSDGTYVLDDNKTFSQWYWEGSSYDKTTEPITGYTPDINQVRGTMGNQDIIMDVHYDLITYSFTVQYRKVDGTSAHPNITVTGTVLDNDKYIISPAVEGYQAGTKYVRWRPGSSGSSLVITYTAISPGISWAEVTDGNYIATSEPYPLTVKTLINGNPSGEDNQGNVEPLQDFTTYVWTGCNVTVHWEGSSYVPSTWSGYTQEVSWNNGSGTQTKTYDNTTDSFTITSNNNIFASTNFTERQ